MGHAAWPFEVVGQEQAVAEFVRRSGEAARGRARPRNISTAKPAFL